MTEHLAHGVVMIRVLLQAVKIAIQALLECGQNKNAPQLHARAARGVPRLRRETLFEQREQLLALLIMRVDFL